MALRKPDELHDLAAGLWSAGSLRGSTLLSGGAKGHEKRLQVLLPTSVQIRVATRGG